VVNLPLNAVGNIITNYKLEASGGSSSFENTAGAGRGEDYIMVSKEDDYVIFSIFLRGSSSTDRVVQIYQWYQQLFALSANL